MASKFRKFYAPPPEEGELDEFTVVEPEPIEVEKTDGVFKAKRKRKPRHTPTAKTRAQVEALAGVGVAQQDICAYIGIGNKNTLVKYYRNQLDNGMAQGRGKVVQTLFKMATSGDNFQATKFWLTQKGGPDWKEVQRHEIGVADLRELARKRAHELGIPEEEAIRIATEIEKKNRKP